MKNLSIVTRIGIALSAMVGLTIVTLLASYWLSEKADHDALAINIAGSLRYQAYQYTLQVMYAPEQAEAVAAQLAASWDHDVFKRFQHEQSDLAQQFQNSKAQWQAFQRQIANHEIPHEQLMSAIKPQIAHINQVVTAIQQDAEARIRSIRSIQVVSLFSSIRSEERRVGKECRSRWSRYH